MLTSKLNFLVDTIISRCQIIRFKPYSEQELKQFLEESKLKTKVLLPDGEVLENLVFISNGSPGKLVDYLKIWDQIPESIKNEIKSPIKSYENILILAKNITSNLDLNQQKFLLDYMQRLWWKKTKDKRIAEIIDNIKNHINSNIHSRLSWEVGLLKIKIENW